MECGISNRGQSNQNHDSNKDDLKWLCEQTVSMTSKKVSIGITVTNHNTNFSEGGHKQSIRQKPVFPESSQPQQSEQKLWCEAPPPTSNYHVAGQALQQELVVCKLVACRASECQGPGKRVGGTHWGIVHYDYTIGTIYIIGC